MRFICDTRNRSNDVSFVRSFRSIHQPTINLRIVKPRRCTNSISVRIGVHRNRSTIDDVVPNGVATTTKQRGESKRKSKRVKKVRTRKGGKVERKKEP